MDSEASATELGVECARETYTCAPWYLRQHVSGFAHGARDLQQDVSVLVAAVLFLWIGGWRLIFCCRRVSSVAGR